MNHVRHSDLARNLVGRRYSEQSDRIHGLVYHTRSLLLEISRRKPSKNVGNVRRLCR